MLRMSFNWKGTNCPNLSRLPHRCQTSWNLHGPNSALPNITSASERIKIAQSVLAKRHELSAALTVHVQIFEGLAAELQKHDTLALQLGTARAAFSAVFDVPPAVALPITAVNLSTSVSTFLLLVSRYQLSHIHLLQEQIL